MPILYYFFSYFNTKHPINPGLQGVSKYKMYLGGVYTPKGDCLPQGIILEATAAHSAHHAVVLPASPVIRRQISICTAEAVLLSQIWDMRFKVHCTANLPPFFMRPVSNIPQSAFGIRTPSQLHPGTSPMFFTGCHGLYLSLILRALYIMPSYQRRGCS